MVPGGDGQVAARVHPPPADEGIKEELGEGGDDDEIEELRERLRRAQLPTDAEKIAKKQLSRLALDAAAVGRVQRHQDLPRVARRPARGRRRRPTSIDVADVRRCLDEDHFGLEKVKKRIVEYVGHPQAPQGQEGPDPLLHRPARRRQDLARPSIARSMGRRYGRIALGGVRDEAEIRGHRRTYVGALPGRIMQALKKVGVKNPVLVLDEVDKMGVDMRGDPAAALLEVLDPEQNVTFQDHYIDCPFDRLADHVPGDREQLRRPSPPPARPHGGDRGAAATRATRSSTSRASSWCPSSSRSTASPTSGWSSRTTGICDAHRPLHAARPASRNLEREIAADVPARRRAARRGRGRPRAGDPGARREGARRRRSTSPRWPSAKGEPGRRHGARLDAGGRRASSSSRPRKMPGKGNTTLTGNMRNVMQESATTAVSFVRSRGGASHASTEWLKLIDLHVHIPQGGHPQGRAERRRDDVHGGRVAAARLPRQARRRDDRRDHAARQRAARWAASRRRSWPRTARASKTVLIPHRNERDLEDVPSEVRAELDVKLIRKMDEISRPGPGAPRRARERPSPRRTSERVPSRLDLLTAPGAATQVRR